MDIFQHTQRSFLLGFQFENKRVWKYRHDLLIKASMYGSTSVVRLVLEAGADVNQTDGFGHEAIIWATVNGYSDVVHILLAAGANVCPYTQHEIEQMFRVDDFYYP